MMKTRGYWNDRENCLDEFMTYVYYCGIHNQTIYKKGFERFNRQAYRGAHKNGWLDEWISIYDTDETIHCNRDVYVFKFLKQKAVYVGLSLNVKERNRGHKIYKKSSVAKFAVDNGCKIPKMKVVQYDLTEEDAQYWEDTIKKIYKSAGWTIINKAPTGIGIGSLGGTKPATKEEVTQIMSEFSCLRDFRRTHKHYYEKYRKEDWFKNYNWQYSIQEIASMSKRKHTKEEYEVVKKEAEKAGIPLWIYNKNVYDAAWRYGYKRFYVCCLLAILFI